MTEAVRFHPPREYQYNASIMEIYGGQSLSGELSVTGYKHALSLLIPAAILTGNEETILENVPNTFETRVQVKMLRALGTDVQVKDEEHTLRFHPNKITQSTVPPALSSTIHGSVYLVPALLGRFGEVTFGSAGGDRIGESVQKSSRSMEHVVSVMERFGAQFTETKTGLHGTCDTLLAQEIDIDDYTEDPETGSGPFVSGATKTAILAAAVAQGTSVIKHPWNKEAARELLSFLKAAGCRMNTEHDDYWEIQGGLQQKPLNYFLISDPTEIMAYIALSTHLRSPLTITQVTTDAIQKALEPELEALSNMGVVLQWEDGRIHVNPPDQLLPVNIAATSRGINTDHHPFFTLMLTTAEGRSSVTDHVWGQRFKYVDHLKQLGAYLQKVGNTVYINPQKPYRSGQLIHAADTRAGAVAIIAAYGIKGKTTIVDLHTQRGYEGLLYKIEQLKQSV